MATKPAAKKTASKSTAVATTKKTGGAVVSVAEIQAQLKAQAEALNGKVAPASGITIQVSQSKEFKLPDGTKADELDVVILDFVSSNVFYEGEYDKDNISPPACFAIGENPLALVPSDNSPLKQANECKGCPMNEFGSSGKGKACKNTRVLAVMPAEANDETPIWLLKVSPTAIKAFDSYVRSVAATFQMPPVAVVTKVSFDENSDYPSLRFGDPQPNENLAVHFARQEEAKTLLQTEPDVSQYGAAQEKKAPPRRPAAKTAGRR